MISDDVSSDDDTSWFSVVGYASYTMKKNWSLAYRAEYFDDKENYLGIGASVVANTLSLNYKEGNFTFIPEFRLDSATKDIFSDGSPKKISAFVVLATTYSF